MVIISPGNIWSYVDYDDRSASPLRNILNLEFKIEVPGAKYLYAFKSGEWDGHARLWEMEGKGFKLRTGLVPKLISMLERGGVPWQPGTDQRNLPRGHQFLQTKVPLYDYQFAAVKAAFQNTQTGFGWWPRGVLEMATGCVDADTEYLSPTGWCRIADYEPEGLVAQYNEDSSISFMRPEKYIKVPCSEFWEIKTKYGLNQRLSDEHQIVYKSTKRGKNLLKISAAEMIDRHHKNKWGFKCHFITTFNGLRTPPRGIDLTDNHLRLQVAVIADGSFDPRVSTKRAVLRLKKQRKKDRLERLLFASSIPFKKQKCSSAVGFDVYTFNAPMRCKEFGPSFWAATNEQLEVIRNEVLYWDGNCKNEFYTSNETTADFIQYAFTAGGKRVSQNWQHRIREGRKDSLECKLQISDRALVTMINSRKKLNISKVASTDGFKYCFTVPSGMLLLRRNHRIFVTGNSGKTETAVAMYQMNPVSTFFLVHRKDLLIQAKKRFEKYGHSPGVIGGGEFNPIAGLNIATLQTLKKIFDKPDDTRAFSLAALLINCEQVFIDEAHLLSSSLEKGNEFMGVADRFDVPFKWGLTATPFMRSSYDNLLLEGATGSSLYTINAKTLIDMGRLTPPIVTMKHVPGKMEVSMDWKKAKSNKARSAHWRDVEMKGIKFNEVRTDLIIEEIKAGPYPLLTLVKTVEQAEFIKKLYRVKYGKDLQFLSGKDKATVRRDAAQALQDGTLDTLLTTTIFDEGVDIPNLRKVILASGGKSAVKTIQRVGRALRKADGKTSAMIIDFKDGHHPMLERHAKARKKIYDEQEFKVITEPARGDS